jgi:hypothetical protein
LITALPPIVGTETFVSFADANALAADRLNATEWQSIVANYEAAQAAEAQAVDTDPIPLSEAIPVQCRQALMSATAILNRLKWRGELQVPLQALAWPRRCAGAPASGIPPAVATAYAELAIYLLSPEASRRRDVQMSMIGQSMETYFAEVIDELPKHVRRLVEPLLRVGSSHAAGLIP